MELTTAASGRIDGSLKKKADMVRHYELLLEKKAMDWK